MTERGDEVRNRLKRNKLSQVWLIEQLRRRGIITDKTELSSVLSGSRNGVKADAILTKSVDILDKYERAVNHT